MELGTAASWGMVKRPQKAVRSAKREPPPLFIGQWIRALGSRPRDVVRATGMNEGYLSELIKGSKKNASTALLADIAEFLGIPPHYLHRPPPSQETINQLGDFDPGLITRLRSARHREKQPD